MSEEYDETRLIKAVIFFIAAIVLLVYVYPTVYTYVFGQVEIKQSQSVSNSFGIDTHTTTKTEELFKAVKVTRCALDPLAFSQMPIVRCYKVVIYDNGKVTENGKLMTEVKQNDSKTK